MRLRLGAASSCLFVLLVGITIRTSAGESPATSPATEAPAPARTEASDGSSSRPASDKLPPPLDKIVCNIADLEQSGHFELSASRLGRSEDFGEEALIWTVRVRTPVSCRHAMILLNRLSDVRFFWTEKDWQKELYSTGLRYSSRLAEGAVHHEILQQDEEFQIWVLLDQRYVDMLVLLKADTLVFHSPQTMRVRLLSPSTRRWTSAGSGLPRWFSKRPEATRVP